MTTPSEPDLDHRLRAAGTALDELAATRTAIPVRRRRPAPRLPHLGGPPRLAVATAAVAFALLAVTAAVAARIDRGDRPAVDERPAPTGPSAVEEVPEVARDDLADLGAHGLVVAADAGLVDLTSGQVTPLLSPADILGNTAPTAVPDGRGGIYYIAPQSAERHPGPTSEPGTPLARPELRHLADGHDTLVEAGATSFALRADGALALAVAVDPAIRQFPFDTTVVVVAPDGDRATWAGPADQQVVAWGGDRLLVERALPESETTSLHVIDAEGGERELSPQGQLLAVGPAGTWALVAGLSPGNEPVHDAPYEAPPPRAVDLASGNVIGTLDLDPPLERIGPLTWTGDDRLVGVTVVPGTAVPVLVEVTVEKASEGMVSLVEVRRVELDPGEVFAPTDAWASADGTLVALASTSDRRHRPRLIICRPEDACTLVEPPFGYESQMSHVVNPSRPLSR